MMCKRWIFLAGLPLLVGLALILMLPPVSVGWAQSDDDKPNNVLYLPLISQPSEPIHEDAVHVATDQQGEVQLYLDQANGNSAEKGTVDHPFREFTDAANVVSSGGNITILPGAYRAVGVLSKPMTLEAPEGGVTINYTTDTDGDGLDDNWEQALAEMYRPIMIFDKNEGHWPTSARWFAQYSYLRLSGEQQIFSQSELYNDPTLVLRAHELGYESSDLRRNPNPKESFHIDISGEGDPYCGEGALNGCRDGAEPDLTRLPRIPIYVVVHQLLEDVETDANIDTTGLYLLHFQYGFAYNAVSGGAHEGDWERLEVYINPGVDPFNVNDEHRREMLRGIKYYAHHCTYLSLPDNPRFPSDDGIPKVYVETGQHGFFREPRKSACDLIRDVDGDREPYRVEKVVNLGERFTRIVRLEESRDEIEDRNIALFFNGVFGERKDLCTIFYCPPDGVVAPGLRIPPLP